jgi:hypothetical protein
MFQNPFTKKQQDQSHLFRENKKSKGDRENNERERRRWKNLIQFKFYYILLIELFTFFSKWKF